MQQCVYHYDLNARDTILEYVQQELSHSSTAARDARAPKISQDARPTVLRFQDSKAGIRAQPCSGPAGPR